MRIGRFLPPSYNGKNLNNFLYYFYIFYYIDIDFFVNSISKILIYQYQYLINIIYLYSSIKASKVLNLNDLVVSSMFV